MPDSKYFDRPGKGVTKHTLGFDNEDLSTTIKREAIMDKTLPIPTERTCDKQMNEDGGLRAWKPKGR